MILGIGDILEQHTERYRVSSGDVLGGNPPEARKAATYLVKKHTGMTNQKIGERFGGLSYSAVTKVYRRLEEEVEKNHGLRRIVSGIERDLSNVNRLTPILSSLLPGPVSTVLPKSPFRHHKKLAR